MKSRLIFWMTSLLLVFAFAEVGFSTLNISGLWAGNIFTKTIPDKYGPAIIAKNGGNLLFLAKDGALYEITMAGAVNPKGQPSEITNIVAPPTYITDSSNQYIIYTTAQGTAQNKLVVHKFGSGSGGTVKSTSIDNAAYGVNAYLSGSKIVIFTGTMHGTLYKVEYDTSSSNFAVPTTANLAGPIKIPPVLSPSKTELYVLTQNGKFYTVDVSTMNASLKIELGGDFTTPMAMDESGFLYALSNDGIIYKIDPSGSENHARFLSSANSSGPLIDGDGIIYIFGDNGKVVALNSNLLKLGEYTIGQQITTTPAIVKGIDGVTYLIIPSSTTGAGKITILSFDAVTGVFTKVWEYAVPSTFPISAAVNVAPLGALYGDNYYFVTATNDGTVYAWQFNARGPYGIWAKYGQNINNTGFIDSTAIAFKTKIFLIAKEGYYGRELSGSLLGSTISYGLLYDAKVVDANNTVVNTYTNYRTNETNLAKVIEGVPGSQKLVVKFATPTDAKLLIGRYVTPSGGISLSKDSTFKFKFWKTGPNDYEGSEGDNPATITFRYNDRKLEIFTDATYTFYVYHKYPLQSNSEAAMTKDFFFDYNSFRNNPDTAVAIINASPTHAGKTFFAYKWNVYTWNPSEPTGYTKKVYYDQDSVKLPLSGPAYLEIFYAELNATVTLLLPEFAYGKTRAYLFLDAAPNSIAETIKLTTLKGITIDRIVSQEYAPEVTKLENLSSVDSNFLQIVLSSFERPLTDTTRVATIALNLMFPEKVRFTGVDSAYYMEFFDLYGYAQTQGQNVEPELLRAKRSFRTNKFLYVVGDFNEDFVVDINDWNMFVSKLGSTVDGADVIYNIGPRDDFIPPYPDYDSYRAGYLTDTTNKVDDYDLYYFASMFGFAVPASERVK
ncbi:PQQ-binding-like beta-propeller repeat protein [Fervidobacterium pennivorans subsp. shakshaketiis]|uniref:Uncharacterized protein n=1 Tax=Fervidobacterium pennivorans (strain DSM 9078 / Ven5) TaxID=771875 RepID=H9U9J2_FERPD|nr:PQQ-binding-like beta-propeller repeat protein [Fervidobacterium pennivorans]AFG34185.1 hypothetical protein Ferpe_0022 [Fervidobacterium pennivorans DSM 9078]QIV77564.1 PQQ-like beta-propeller repeat protein [Fervidobacterium pennivorans subsp. keratinolyticus]